MSTSSHDLKNKKKIKIKKHQLPKAVTDQSLKYPERNVMCHRLPSRRVSIALMKCVCEVSLCLCVRAKGLEGVDVCLLE